MPSINECKRKKYSHGKQLSGMVETIITLTFYAKGAAKRMYINGIQCE